MMAVTLAPPCAHCVYMSEQNPLSMNEFDYSFFFLCSTIDTQCKAKTHI